MDAFSIASHVPPATQITAPTAPANCIAGFQARIGFQNACHEVRGFGNMRWQGRGLLRHAGERLRELHLAAALRGNQEPALECPPIGFRKFATHVGIDQICFGRIQSGHIVPVGEGAILHPDLFFFGQAP